MDYLKRLKIKSFELKLKEQSRSNQELFGEVKSLLEARQVGAPAKPVALPKKVEDTGEEPVIPQNDYQVS